MERLTLTPKDVEYLVLEASVITPDTMSGKTLEEIEQLPVLEGNTTWPLGRFFSVTGKVADSAEDQGIIIAGDVPRVKYIGSKMTAGAVLCKGDVDMYCGAWMKGGRIRVKGDADAFCAIQMEGGDILFEGNVFDYLGASYRGDWRGMKGGNIVVNGNAGQSVGEYMMGGRITIKGDVGINAGIHMGKGIGRKDTPPRIIIHGNTPGRVGAFMNFGHIFVLGKIEAMMPGFSTNGTEEVDIDGVLTTFQVLDGDHGEKGKGKLFVKM
ncbi:MAG: formylmethanofuran dehydrogenase subunit C [Halobacteriota archaeon]